jgi:hypothetical protein
MTSNDIWKIIKAKGTKTYCCASIALLVTVIVFIISNFPEGEALRRPVVTKHSKCPKLQKDTRLDIPNLLLPMPCSSKAASGPPKSGTLLTISLRKSNTLKVCTHCFL